MKLLVLGGTVFVGRHLVEAALLRGHEVTLFNRGRNNPSLFPGVEKLQGDRDGGLAPLRGRQWEAVIDTSGYVPRLVADSARLLADAVRLYTFISSISVYRDFRQPGITEGYPVGTLADEGTEAITGESYGPLKALCEQAAEEAMPGRVLNVRAGLIVGPHDPTDRFTYWPVRVARGGDVLVPASPERLLQFIDARDLAEWTLTMAETGGTGTLNVSGPALPYPMADLFDTCTEVSGSDARPVWVSEAFLLEQGVGPWMELPLWIPVSLEESTFMQAIDCRAALDRGLTFRSVADTVADTLLWDAGRTVPDAGSGYGLGLRGAGLTTEREADLLAAWRGYSL